TSLMGGPDDKSEDMVEILKKPNYLGYESGSDDLPIFKYSLEETNVSDQIRHLDKGRELRRDITVENMHKGNHFNLLITSRKMIKKLPNDLFVVGDKEYYIH